MTFGGNLAKWSEFLRKSRARRSFWRLDEWNLEESLERNASFADLTREFWSKSRNYNTPALET